MTAKSHYLQDDVQNKVAFFAINRFAHDWYKFKCFLRLLAKIKVKSHYLQDDHLFLMSPQNTRYNIDLQVASCKCFICNASAWDCPNYLKPGCKMNESIHTSIYLSRNNPKIQRREGQDNNNWIFTGALHGCVWSGHFWSSLTRCTQGSCSPSSKQRLPHSWQK